MEPRQVPPLRWLGWRQVGLAGLMDFASTGLFFYSFGVFLPHVERELDLTRGQSSLGLSIFLAVGALASPLIGRFLDRPHLGRVMAVGAVLLGLGLGTVGMLASVPGAALGLVVAGVGGATLGLMAPARLISNWFVRSRGTALGMAAVGISASGVIMPPLANLMIGAWGWQSSLLAYGALGCLVIAPAAFFLTVTHPLQAGQTPDNARPADVLPAAAPMRSRRPPGIRQIYRAPPFRFAVLVFGGQFFATGAVLAHTVPLALSLGLSAEQAAGIASATALFAVAGKLLFGYIGDRFTLHFALGLSAALQMLGLGLAAALPQPWPALYGLVILFGLGFGANVVLQNLMLARFFGPDMGMVMATSRPPITVIQISGPPLTGFLFDYAQGSYDLALWLHAAVYAAILCGALALARARWNHPRYHPLSRPFSGVA